jgi:hypothetical protein
MADLNALISQGAQFRIPPPVDPLGNMPQLLQMRAAQNQNALAQYQLSSAQREDAATNALNIAYQNAYDPATGKIDPNRLRQSLASSGAGARIPVVEKALAEAENTRLQQDKLRGEIGLQPITKSAAEVKLLDDKLKQSRGFLDNLDATAPDAGARYLAWHEANHADPIIGPALAARGVNANQSRAAIEQAIAKGPQALADLINQSKLGAEKFMELNKATVTSQNLGGELRMMSTPGLGGAATEVPGSRVATTMTPGQIAANQIAQGQLGVSRGQLAATLAGQQQALDLANRPVFNEAGQGFVSRPTAAQPAGAFTPLPEIKATQDQRAAVKALKTAGYNPETGEDNISKLIAESTSGGLQAASAGAKGFLFGSSTSGMKAISALAGTANQIALDIAGGKLGAGISNSDRDFIASALGDVANPYKTAEERLAGWTAAKDRMVRSGMIPPPNKPSLGAPTRANAAKARAAPAGVDPVLWGVMTPEEQKLWAK